MEKESLEDKLNIEYRGTRCPAHLYKLIQQGGEKSRYIYKCERNGCRHYATLEDIEGRIAQCRNCGNVFIVDIATHVIKDVMAKQANEFLELEPHCCNSIIVHEVNELAYKLE